MGFRGFGFRAAGRKRPRACLKKRTAVVLDRTSEFKGFRVFAVPKRDLFVGLIPNRMPITVQGTWTHAGQPCFWVV